MYPQIVRFFLLCGYYFHFIGHRMVKYFVQEVAFNLP